MRRLFGLFLSSVLLAACGGGGGGGGGSGGNPTDPTPPPETTLYVRASGSDDNNGTSPDSALRSVARATQRGVVAANQTILVGPGIYTGRADIAGVPTSEEAPLRIIADPSGSRTGDAPGEVVLDANGLGSAVRITNTTFVTIDGFTITGATGDDSTGVFVRSNATNATIRNCVINNGGSADGIRIQDSSDATIFNNLIFDNGRGVVISGSPAARVINNTIVNNRNFGISFAGASAENVASTDGTVLNNIVQASRSTINLQVDDGPPSALPGYVGDFNLVFAPTLGDQQQRTYRPTFLQAEHDVNEDAQFVNFAGDDFHLAETSPARDAGTSEIDDDLRNELFDRTTSSDDALDSAPPDLGYHFPVLDQQ